MIWDISIALQILSTIKDTLAKTVNDISLIVAIIK